MKVIMAFPGTGKTYLKSLRKNVLDLDSSSFRKYNGWEEHYVDVVETILKEDKYDILLLCMYTKIMQIMKERGLGFTAVIPHSEDAGENKTIKEMMFGRYVLRDNSHIRDQKSWMYQMKKNYDVWASPEEVGKYTDKIKYIDLKNRYLINIMEEEA